MVGWSVDCGWVLFLYPSVSVDREDGLTLFGFVKGLYDFDVRISSQAREDRKHGIIRRVQEVSSLRKSLQGLH